MHVLLPVHVLMIQMGLEVYTNALVFMKANY
jgi:hypothetical protein